MEILEILNESSDQLLPEDLDFFETELATGGYEDSYRAKCMEKIKKLRKWNKGDISERITVTDKTGKVKPAPKGLVLGMMDVLPENEKEALPKLSVAELIKAELFSIRERSDYKSSFKDYVKNKKEIDEDFIDKNYSIFDTWEIDAIVSVKQLSEDFLEKYFGAVDHDKLARYQQFSEGFFMKHFAQLNAETVLIYGKNEWRKKENRSKQLDVFLRLKGVKY